MATNMKSTHVDFWYPIGIVLFEPRSVPILLVFQNVGVCLRLRCHSLGCNGGTKSTFNCEVTWDKNIWFWKMKFFFHTGDTCTGPHLDAVVRQGSRYVLCAYHSPFLGTLQVQGLCGDKEYHVCWLQLFYCGTYCLRIAIFPQVFRNNNVQDRKPACSAQDR